MHATFNPLLLAKVLQVEFSGEKAIEIQVRWQWETRIVPIQGKPQGQDGS